MGGTIQIDKASKQKLDKKLKGMKKLPFNEAIIRTLFDIKRLAQVRLKDRGHIETSRLRNSIYVKWPQQSKANRLSRGDNSKAYSWNGGSGSRDLNITLGKNEGAVGTNVEYASAIERGARPHKIRVKNAKTLGTVKTGFFGKEVNHPGYGGDSYLYWATRNINRNINKYMKEVAKKTNKYIK